MAKRIQQSTASAKIALAAALTSLCASGIVLMLAAADGALVPSYSLVALSLALPVALVSAICWATSRAAIEKTLSDAVDAVGRIADQEPGAGTASGEGREVALAVEAARQSITARQSSMRIQAALASLMGAGIRRLAEGDYSTRIKVDLPQDHRPLAQDFNAVAATLQETQDRHAAQAELIAAQAGEIAVASSQLDARAAALATRIESDVSLIDRTLDRHDRDDLSAKDLLSALRAARHTMSGVLVAARRNQDAAKIFAGIGANLGEAVAQGDALQGAEDLTQDAEHRLRVVGE
jgi:methyl-accepting chemotaxis protein